MSYRLAIMIATWILLVPAAQAIELAEECIIEPVFQGEVCVYQANREAERAIVLVHGIGDNASRDWNAQLEPLAQYYRVVTFDLPGFGRSAQGDKRYTPEQYAALIDFIADHYQLPQFDLMGHSMGGAISLLYAADHPQRVRRLLLSDVAGILHRLAIGKYVIAGSINGNQEATELAESYVVKIIEKFERFFSFFRDDVAEQSEHARAGIELVDYDFSAVLQRLVVPTQIIWGADDRIAPLRTALVLQHRIRDARLEVIDGAGHVPMRDDSEHFNRLMLDFFLTDALQDFKVPQQLKVEQEPVMASCEDQKGKVYSGNFSRLSIKNCSGVVIQDAQIDGLDIFESRVVIKNSHIGGDVAVAMDVIGSDVKVTASTVNGNVALKVARSRLDLAAVDLLGVEQAVQAMVGSRLIFSVSAIGNGGNTHPIHRMVTLESGQTL